MMLARIASMIGCAALAGTLAAQPQMRFHAAPGPEPRMWFAGGDPAALRRNVAAAPCLN